MTPRVLSPGDTVGILGGGQLGRMLAIAAAELGLAAHVLCPDDDPPAAAVARHTALPYEAQALATFARQVDVLTYEFENVPVEPVRPLGALVRPGPAALEAAQDRLTEKAFLADCGLPVAPHRAVGTRADLDEAVAALGPDAILKTRRLGYDGKGQVRLSDDLDAAWDAIAGAPAILEAVVPFTAESSTVLARAADGTVATYAHPANHHEGGILRRSVLPGPLSPAEERAAATMAQRVAERLDYVGVLAIEWFVTGDPARPLIANEMAPRVHNTGHWTQDAAVTSQFENHIRAIAGWPLGATDRTHDVTMLNLLGAESAAFASHLETPSAKLHLYGKREARPGRKMGHVNRLGRLVDSAGSVW